jgi:hypothetical protein
VTEENDKALVGVVPLNPEDLPGYVRQVIFDTTVTGLQGACDRLESERDTALAKGHALVMELGDKLKDAQTRVRELETELTALDDVRSVLSRIEHEAAAARDALPTREKPERPSHVPSNATAWKQLPSGLWAWRTDGFDICFVQDARPGYEKSPWQIRSEGERNQHYGYLFKTEFLAAVSLADFNAAREFMGWE